MDRDRLAEERALIRAAAEGILSGAEPQDLVRRNYRQMARGTLAALDWIEGRRLTAPSSGRPAAPEDELTPDRSSSWKPTAFILEILNTEDWGSGHVRTPNQDMHYHGAVWALLCWWRDPGRPGGLAITVPGLPGDAIDALNRRD